ncbi:Lrp/AsnC family transcriptional regulator [Reinekea marina]|uniref:Lrp/AsnC family transcriptional regulator n=1 Tax=Reinekea marina TaxID=1310421 RepID=A0ABV7WSL5_9GAMM|nr:Lrp/AsnC family transcriptional regulator [Reinekea marina]MBU2864540.1 Lrp/AsnC family transcriptional regulator [Reinekea forsetii]MDN3647726.1 Lrp/AsnC family transcriptional regulator [Reinekea marina]
MESESHLDRYDRKILEIIQTDASLSNQDIADQIGLSASPCSRRIKSLEDRGYIQRRITVVNPKSVNLNLTAILNIRMDKHTPERFENFEQRVAMLPEVIECLLVTGQDADYQLKVVVPDMDEYHNVLLKNITTIEGVDGVHSSFLLRQIINHKALPLKYI